MPRYGSDTSAPAWRSFWSAPGFTPFRPSGSRSRPISPLSKSQPKVVGLMYVMLLFGMIVSALGFGAFLADFTPGRLVQVIQGAAVATIVLNGISLWKQETRGQALRTPSARRQPSFAESWDSFTQGDRVIRRLAAVGLGTMAFSMEDVLLEPYGGQVLRLAVGDTTKLTAALAVGGLLGFWLASPNPQPWGGPVPNGECRRAGRRPRLLPSDPVGAGDVAVAVRFGNAADRLRGRAIRARDVDGDHESRAQGAVRPRSGRMGAVQASAAGIAIALGGVIRDSVAGYASATAFGAASAYDIVYAIEIVLLLATLVLMSPLIRRAQAYA